MRTEKKALNGYKKGKQIAKLNSDKAIQDTNGSSIVSKRSVERLYYPTTGHAGHNSSLEDAHFLRYFVKKPQRRAPLINRGYWIRMEAVHTVVKQFLQSNKGSRKVIVNLGCGYDPLPFQYLAKKSTNRSKTIFVDVDYPDLINLKVSAIAASEDLSRVVGDRHQLNSFHSSIKLASSSYYCVGCDLSNLPDFEKALEACGVLQSDCDLLFIAEVSLTYMNTEEADKVVQWACGIAVGQTQFALLEQILPAGADHPFARTMLRHFNHLNTPIKSVSTYPTIEDQINRFETRGWSSVSCTDLHTFWCKSVSAEEKSRMETIEHFDEWEEFFLFCQHYILLVASTNRNPANGHVAVSIRPSTADRAWIVDSVEHPLLRRRWGAAASKSDTSILYFGGLSPTTRLGTSVVVTSDDDRPFSVNSTTSPSPRMCHAIAALSPGRFLMTGGRGSPAAPLSDCWTFRSGSNEWEQTTSMPGSRYRHAMATISPGQVVVFGGQVDDTSSAEWLLFDAESSSWTELECEVKLGMHLSPGFCWLGKYGILSGGFNRFGDIYEEVYKWSVSGNRIILESVSDQIVKDNLARGGCQMVSWTEDSVLLVGGIQPHGILQMNDSFKIISFTEMSTTNIEVYSQNNFPMLIGCSVHITNDKEIVVVGGGAVCFSFGACWNELAVVRPVTVLKRQWTVAVEAQKALAIGPDMSTTRDMEVKTTDMTDAQESIEGTVTIGEIGQRDPKSVEDWKEIYSIGMPVLVKNADIGSCTSTWTPDYVKDKVGVDRPVTVHISKSHAMNFQRKNFRYDVLPFGEFIDRVYGVNDNANDSDELLYLRSLSALNPKSKTANIVEDFPAIATDFQLPPELRLFIGDKAFSSPLRISSPGVGMWLHYDVTANFLIQVRGTKRVRLYPPSDVSELSVPAGASSSRIPNIFDKSGNSIVNVHPLETVMCPGDIIFIPAMWLHATLPVEPSISINIFWKDLEPSLYSQGRDIYGNRDLKAYEEGRALIKRISKSFDAVPAEIRQFYLARLSDELRNG
ncbi:S-adenosyl-L-methionine-dependent methyltransferase [Lipomyces orientalis]|uniref:S-adenosyl-L-methionine-dependent methyltransferase n=1 Tax=Lipomyces orientalis TaxID=1233043 RepID=A0ACC3TZQ8_9ASCO